MEEPRERVSVDALMRVGVAKRMAGMTLEDFDDFGDPALKVAKDFVGRYIADIEGNVDGGVGICFVGSNGVGKSMLSCIILKEAYRRRYTCRRASVAEYIEACSREWGASHEEREFYLQDRMERYKGVDLLVLEEVGKELDTRVAKPTLEDLLRYREEKGLATISCSNMPPDEVARHYGESVASLLRGNAYTVVLRGADQRKGEVLGDFFRKGERG